MENDRYYLIIVWDDVEPELFGPFASEDERDRRAREIRRDDDALMDGIYTLDLNLETEEVVVDTYPGGFFEGGNDD